MALLTPVPILLLLCCTAAAIVSAAAPRRSRDESIGGSSGVITELLGQPADDKQQRQPTPVRAKDRRQVLEKPDPYDEYAEPRQLDWPKGHPAERIRRRVLWRVARDPELLRRQRELERLGPLKPHRRDSNLDRPDPYSEFASVAYYRFVRDILDMRNRVTGFDESSGINEFFEDTKPPRPEDNSKTTSRPPQPPQPTMTPSPPVQVCPPRWRLGARRCEVNATFCFNDAECPGTRCCFDGCRLRCLEPELLIKHVCKDYMNSTVFPGDLYMHQREQICTCDPLGRPVACKDKKPCIDVISNSLFKLPFITNETVKLKKRERTTREKIYDALQEAFKHVRQIY